MSKFASDVKLGEKYRDEQTGIEGIATSVHFYQFACERITLEFLKKDGELMTETFDAPRLRAIHPTDSIKLKVTKTGGPARPGETRSVEGGRR